MSRERLVEMARQNLVHVRDGTIDLAPEIGRVPVTNYYDPTRWQAEVAKIFKRLPLMLAFSCELREPGAYKAMEIAGVPVLLNRGSDGNVRAFVNMCSHRGAIIVPEGVGTARRFTCPYHAWSYNEHGDLVGIFDRADFGEIDTSCLGLTPLPVAERAGLVFATLTPGASLDIDSFLCGYDAMLDHFGFADWHLISSRTVPGPNWKVAYDGYLDFYHLPVLHKNTFGPNYPNRALYHAWGPHQRVTAPNPKLSVLEGVAEDEWDVRLLMGGVWTIFPHVSIATFEAGGRGALISQLFPGPDPDTSFTVQNYVIDHEPSVQELELAEKQADLLEYVVTEEDYATGKRIQRAVKVGARPELLFGRNEGGGQHFHGFLEHVLATDTADLPSLFERRS